MSSSELLVSSLNQSSPGSTLQGESISTLQEKEYYSQAIIQDENLPSSADGAIWETVQKLPSLYPALQPLDEEMDITGYTVNSVDDQKLDHQWSIVQANPETSTSQYGKCEDLPSSDSGAVMVWSAPTIFQAEEVTVKGLHTQEPQVVMTATSQPLPEAPVGALDTARLLQVESAELPPSWEQSKSEKPSVAIYNLNSVPLSVENSNAYNSTSTNDKLNLFAQNSKQLQDLLLPHQTDQGTTTEKIISSKQAFKQVLKDTQQSSCYSQHQKSIFKLPNDRLQSHLENSSGESYNRNNSYARALAPPNTKQYTVGTAPECGVLMERLPGFSLDTYALAIQDVIGNGAISFIGRDPSNQDQILVFAKQSQMVESLVSSGIWIRGRWILVSHFQQPAVKLTLSGIMPFVPDGLLIEALSQYGSSVYPILRKIPASVRLHQFKGALSFRREMYLIKSTKDTELPPSFTISFLGTTYLIEVSTTGAKCYACGSLNHTISKCDAPESQPKVSNPTDLEGVRSHQLPSMETTTDLCGSLLPQPVLTLKEATSNINNIKDSTTQKAIKKSDFFTQCNLAELGPLSLWEVSTQHASTQPFRKSIRSKKKKNKPSSIGADEDVSKINPVFKISEHILPNITSLQDEPNDMSLHKLMGNKKKLLNTNMPNKKEETCLLQTLDAGIMDIWSNMTEDYVSIECKKPRKTINRPILDAAGGFGEQIILSPKQVQSNNSLSSVHLEVDHTSLVGMDTESEEEDEPSGSQSNQVDKANFMSKTDQRSDFKKSTQQDSIAEPVDITVASSILDR